MPTEQRGNAFGIEIEATFPVPDLPPEPAGSYPHTRLILAEAREIERAWPSAEAETALRRTLPDGSPVMVVSRHDDVGFQVWAPRYGRHLVSADGSSVSSALPRIAPWRWERLLFAQVLPLAAALRGRELFHASAVSLAGGTFAFVGLSGAGKSSVAAHLVARGASLVTDDVLALERRGDGVTAFPGAALAGLDRGELAAMTPAGRKRVGRRLGVTHKIHLAAPVVTSPGPLRAVYFLARGSSRAIEIKRTTAMAVQLLGSSFLAYLDRPAQLVQHLDVCAHIAERVPTYEVASPSSAQAVEVAAVVEAHARSVSAERS